MTPLRFSRARLAEPRAIPVPRADRDLFRMGY